MEKKTVRLQLVIGETELELIDTWRRDQRDLPNRSEAIRRLISRGIHGADAPAQREKR